MANSSNEMSVVQDPAADSETDRRILAIQVFLVLAAVAWVGFCGRDNNGLGFQGDSPRHAVNGVFWLDLAKNPTLDVRTFALRFYARYPAISPVTYPPFFYWVEAFLFSIFGVSSVAAKGAVLAFLSLGSAYCLAWLRRWGDGRAGWFAPIFPLSPAIVRWSSCVMLNVPAAMLVVASLYHMRRFLDDLDDAQPSLRHMYLAAMLGVTAILTYLPVAALPFVMLGWLIVRRKLGVFTKPQVISVCLVCSLPIIGWLVLTRYYAPVHVALGTPRIERLAQTDSAFFYVRQFPKLFSPFLVCFAGLGVLVSLGSAERRREVILLTIWVLVNYVLLSCITAREARYFVPTVLPITVLGIAGITATITTILGRLLPPESPLARFGVGICWVVVVGSHVLAASQVRVPRVSGMDAVAKFLQRTAPHEPVLYDGLYDGVFTFDVLRADQSRQGNITLGSKVLFGQPIDSPDDVAPRLREVGGCRWIVVERGIGPPLHPAANHLRKALETEDFEFVVSFPIEATQAERVDIYRLKGPIKRHEQKELVFPILGGRTFRVAPL